MSSAAHRSLSEAARVVAAPTHTHTHARPVCCAYPQLQRQRIHMHARIACSRTSGHTTTLCSRSQELTASLPHPYATEPQRMAASARVQVLQCQLMQYTPGCISAREPLVGFSTQSTTGRAVCRRPRLLLNTDWDGQQQAAVSPITGQHAQQAHCAVGWAQRVAATCHSSPEKPDLGRNSQRQPAPKALSCGAQVLSQCLGQGHAEHVGKKTQT